MEMVEENGSSLQADLQRKLVDLSESWQPHGTHYEFIR